MHALCAPCMHACIHQSTHVARAQSGFALFHPENIEASGQWCKWTRNDAHLNFHCTLKHIRYNCPLFVTAKSFPQDHGPMLRELLVANRATLRPTKQVTRGDVAMPPCECIGRLAHEGEVWSGVDAQEDPQLSMGSRTSLPCPTQQTHNHIRAHPHMLAHTHTHFDTSFAALGWLQFTIVIIKQDVYQYYINTHGETVGASQIQQVYTLDDNPQRRTHPPTPTHTWRRRCSSRITATSFDAYDGATAQRFSRISASSPSGRSST